MEVDEVDYSADPNPYEPIWTCPNAPLEATPVGVHCPSFSQFTVIPPSHSDPSPSSSCLSFTALSIDSLRLDCPLLPATLHPLASCTSPSPPFEPSPSGDWPHQTPFELPSSIGFDYAAGPPHPLAISHTPPASKPVSSSSPLGCFETPVIKVYIHT